MDAKNDTGKLAVTVTVTLRDPLQVLLPELFGRSFAIMVNNPTSAIALNFHIPGRNDVGTAQNVMIFNSLHNDVSFRPP